MCSEVCLQCFAFGSSIVCVLKLSVCSLTSLLGPINPEKPLRPLPEPFELTGLSPRLRRSSDKRLQPTRLRREPLPPLLLRLRHNLVLCRECRQSMRGFADQSRDKV